ncbi:MAG: hypothetical protein JNL17_10400 [Cyclobacteriaceae bacterium]|nr:hypothetical protein [Cyclobacteriaceae bacterium]
MKCSALLLVLLPWWAAAQQPFSFQRTQHSREVSFIQLDSAKGVRSTVIEYPKFLIVIELPMIDAGANRATNLAEDVPKAQRYLQYLTREYQKPVKYVLSTHWHLHSLSGITPFFEHGAQLVVAQSNWRYSLEQGLLPQAVAQQYRKQVISVTRDTVLLAKSANPIEVWFLDEQYRFKPTKDYLFFYFPKSQALHASCMCAMNHVDFSQRPTFLYNDRVSDLDHAIRVRQVPVEHLIKLNAEYDATTNTHREPVFSQAYFSEFKQRGTPLHVAVKAYTAIALDRLNHDRDSLLNVLVQQKVSPALLNSVVYACLREQAWPQAVAWAHLLNLIEPGDPNYIDTLGEAYYQSGNLSMAEYYSRVLQRLDAPNFPDALATWARNKAH